MGSHKLDRRHLSFHFKKAITERKCGISFDCEKKKKTSTSCTFN